MPRGKILIIIATLLIAFSASVSQATDESLWTTVTTPDLLIVLDLSGSMDSNPQDGSNIWGVSTCIPNAACNSTSGSNYGYRSSSSTTCNTSCKKIDIAKYALFSLLDDDKNNSITAADMTSLGIRLGLMRYYNCGSSGSDSSSKIYTDSGSCIKLSWGITSDAQTTTTPYASIFCNNATCATPNTTGSNSCTVTTPAKECIAGFGTSNYTPLQYSLREAKRYLDDHKALDDSRTCRQKSVIIITDGADTVSCSAGGNTNMSQRRAPVYQAKQLAAAGYKVYVVGFGASMPNDLKYTLNWMAYYGGTRNPNVTQSGNTASVSVGSNPCSNGTDPGSYALDGYAFLASNPADLSAAIKSAITSIQEANYSFSSQASVAAARVQEENFIYEASFEPKNNTGTNKEPFWVGHLKKYSLSSSGELITPHNWDAGAKLRDTAASARNMWTYKSTTGTALTSFDTTNITAADLGVADTTARDKVVGFYRGDSTYNQESWKLGDLFHTNPMVIKTPTQYFYDPRECGGTSFNTFRTTTANIRTSANGKQLILAGANDGQLHAFRTGNSATDATAGGDEVWSFIPPNLLQKISPIAHSSHASRSTLAAHDYFVDGPIQVADVWLPGAATSGISKTATDWKTLAVFSEGQGSGAYLWSSSATCYSTSTSGFSATYDSTTYKYYCGIYALDVTNTLAANKPTYLWKLNESTPASAPAAPYLAEAWSKMQIGRVRIGGNEKWVGFIGGGYSGASCLSADGATATACNTPATGSSGKGFFVVDLTNGNIIWKFTHADNANMDFSAPASPLPLDLDNDGFIDTVYMGDLGGNIWRFRFCARDANCSTCGLGSYTGSSCTSCATTDWTGSLLYQATNTERGYGLSTPSNTHKQIFTTPTATKDALGNVWVYFGTGENNDPTWKPPTTPTAIPDTNDTKNRLYGIKENSDFTGTHTTANLTNITSTSTTYDGTAATTHGWYINLSTNTLTRSDGSTVASPVGEKMISDPTVFGGVVYFSTYVPDQGTASACGLAGDAFLYGIKYISGAGALDSSGSRTKYIGHGIGSAPIISMRPGSSTADIYATASGGAGTASLTQKLGETPSTSSMTNILYWKDKRLQ